MSTLNEKTLETYIQEYARAHTGGDIEKAKTHKVVQDVIEMYTQREKSTSGSKKNAVKPVRMDGRCDS